MVLGIGIINLSTTATGSCASSGAATSMQADRERVAGSALSAAAAASAKACFQSVTAPTLAASSASTQARNGMARIFDATNGTRPQDYVFTRNASNATHINSSGVLVRDSSANTERLDYTPTGTPTLLGMYLEVASANYFGACEAIKPTNTTAYPNSGLWSETSTSTTVQNTTTGITDPYGGTAASRVFLSQSTSTFVFLYQALNYSQQNISQPCCFSFSARSDATSPSASQVYIATARINGSSPVVNDTNSMAIGPFNLTTSYQRFSGSVPKLYNVSNYGAGFGFANSNNGSGGTYVALGTSSGNFDLYGPQLELGRTTPTSYIFNDQTNSSTAVPALRAAESFTFTASGASIVVTFDDGSTQTINTTPNNTNTINASQLNRPHILYIDAVLSYTETAVGSAATSYTAPTSSKTISRSPVLSNTTSVLTSSMKVGMAAVMATVIAAGTMRGGKKQAEAVAGSVASNYSMVGGRPQAGAVQSSAFVTSSKRIDVMPTKAVSSASTSTGIKTISESDTEALTLMQLVVAGKSARQSVSGSSLAQGRCVDNQGASSVAVGSVSSGRAPTVSAKSGNGVAISATMGSSATTARKVDSGGAGGSLVSAAMRTTSKGAAQATAGVVTSSSSEQHKLGKVEMTAGSTSSGSAETGGKVAAQSTAQGVMASAASTSRRASSSTAVSSTTLFTSTTARKSADAAPSVASTMAIGMALSAEGFIQALTGSAAATGSTTSRKNASGGLLLGYGYAAMSTSTSSHVSQRSSMQFLALFSTATTDGKHRDDVDTAVVTSGGQGQGARVVGGPVIGGVSSNGGDGDYKQDDYAMSGGVTIAAASLSFKGHVDDVVATMGLSPSIVSFKGCAQSPTSVPCFSSGADMHTVGAPAAQPSIPVLRGTLYTPMQLLRATLS